MALASILPASSTEPVLTRDADGGAVVRATRIKGPIKIDGRLDEEAYLQVTAITEFIQQEPIEGAPASESTQAWVMFDDENLYIACRCGDSHPERILANDMRRDSNNQTQQDQFAFALDTLHDLRNGYTFAVSAIGGLREGDVTDERPNFNWNGVWDAKVTRFEGGWIAEMVVPFKSLRYAPGRDQTWGIQLRRFLASKNERVHISPVALGAGTSAINYMSQAGTLVGLQVPPPGLNFEVKPYGITSVTTDRLSRPEVHHDLRPDAGIDAKFGVTKSLTLDATYNTDFAQVESDEAQVNLTRFTLSLPEKREFFLEGAGIYAFGSPAGAGGGGGGARGGMGAGGNDAPTIFYSRRIGLSGTREVPVIGGARLTGKAGPWGIGAFNIRTDDEPAAGAAQTDFTVLRLRHDVLRRSTVGGILTRRSISTKAPGANQVWGFDTNMAFYQNVYLAGYVAQSQTEGVQGDDLSYRAQFNYSADRYGLALDRLVVEPNFNPEIGFLRRENFRRNFAQARFSPRTARSRLVRTFTYQANLEYTTDNKNHLESRELSGIFETEFHNSDAVNAQYLSLYEFLPTPFAIAPGVTIPVGGYSFSNTKFQAFLGQRHRLSGQAAFETGSFYDGDKKTVAFNGRVEITPQLGVEPNISLNWIDLPQGSFTNTVVGGRTTFTMTPRMFVAALVQYSSSTSSLSANMRFRWEYRPSSELFVVYTEGRSTLPAHGTDLQSRGIVVKVNRLFRF